MKPVPTLLTERLQLRKLTLKDAETIFLYFSNPEMTRFYGMEPFESRLEAEKFIKNFLDDYNMLFRWGIVEKDSNRLIGTCGFHAISEKHLRAEIGYEIDVPFWGKGYATEAIKALIEYGMDTLKLQRIGANVYPENISSRRVLEKAGFSHEGLLRNYLFQGGNFHDANVFSILKNEVLGK
ncbi:GNAT family N-acetyltransferase [Sutcliffiella deserti]|uniref:GNAT family N-acetyltransferase n=1 Tax=Sutcliffiella deserti TaxID=2875501 RepID=UPI001CBDB5A4|nr:GNAT family N-acetyltransferase [Sutcliffiella deserti]